MDRPIAVGDLVQVVKWPCCDGKLGYIGKVESLMPGTITDGKCNFCRTYVGRKFSCVMIPWCAPLPWLKRIPPLSELEGTKTDEPIKETA